MQLKSMLCHRMPLGDASACLDFPPACIEAKTCWCTAAVLPRQAAEAPCTLRALLVTELHSLALVNVLDLADMRHGVN